MANLRPTVEGEASESDEEQKNSVIFSSNKYGVAIEGEASESENEDKNLIEYGNKKTRIFKYDLKHDINRGSHVQQNFFRGIELNKVWFVLTEFKYMIWENIKKLVTHNLITSTKKVRDADKMLLKSQMALQIISNNLELANGNVSKIVKVTERLKTTNYLPSIKT